MSVAVLKLLPPGVEGDGVVEDIEPDGIVGLELVSVVSSAPHRVACGAGEAKVSAKLLETKLKTSQQGTPYMDLQYTPHRNDLSDNCLSQK